MSEKTHQIAFDLNCNMHGGKLTMEFRSPPMTKAEAESNRTAIDDSLNCEVKRYGRHYEKEIVHQRDHYSGASHIVPRVVPVQEQDE